MEFLTPSGVLLLGDGVVLNGEPRLKLRWRSAILDAIPVWIFIGLATTSVSSCCCGRGDGFVVEGVRAG